MIRVIGVLTVLLPLSACQIDGYYVTPAKYCKEKPGPCLLMGAAIVAGGYYAYREAQDFEPPTISVP